MVRPFVRFAVIPLCACTPELPEGFGTELAVGVVRDVTWSQDSAEILHITDDGVGTFALEAVDIGTGSTRVLTGERVLPHTLQASSDGQWLYFQDAAGPLDNAPTWFELHRVPLSGGPTERIVDEVYRYLVSPDGSVAIETLDNRVTWAEPASPPAIDVPGGPLAFSPTGETLLYGSGGLDEGVAVLSLADGSTTPFTPGDDIGLLAGVRWTDETAALVHLLGGFGDDPFHVYATDGSGDTERLSRGRSMDHLAERIGTVSPDGRKAAFGFVDCVEWEALFDCAEDQVVLHAVDLESGRVDIVGASLLEGLPDHLAFSPDGLHLAAVRDGTLTVMTLP